MKKYLGWIFAVVTCASLSAFAQDNDSAEEVDNVEDQVAVVLDEVEDSE